MKIRFTIARKISLGYVIILSLMLLTGIFSIVVLRNSRAIDKQIGDVNLPTLDLFKELQQILAQSRKLTNDWIYQPSQNGKQELETLHKDVYPANENSLAKLAKSWNDQETKVSYESAKKAAHDLFISEKQILQLLNTAQAYDSAELIEKAIKIMDESVITRAAETDKIVAAMIESQQENSELLTQEKLGSFNRVEILIVTLTLASIALGIILALFAIRSITKPVIELKNSILALSKGQLQEINIKKSDDEIGEMIDSCNLLVVGLTKTTEFTEQIASGKLDVQYETLSNIKMLDSALFKMRDSLVALSTEEKKRTWATRGLAEIGTILRLQTSTPEEFYVNIIRFVVKYTGSNQGSLFILETGAENEQYIRLVGCYAWDKRKYIEKRIELGEGLIGQCVLERETIYMLNIPKNYLHITSGLGDALPNALMIVPLKINDEIHGVIEIASFQKFSKEEIEFIEKLSENIASAISTVRTNDHTKVLLSQSQQQAEEMRAQEEEMRQNMEELSATQEEMSRKEAEYISRIQNLENALAGEPTPTHGAPTGR